MSKFKVGDRVRMYDIVDIINGKITLIDEKDNTFKILTDDKEDYWAHEKQCRKLVKKKKPTSISEAADYLRKNGKTIEETYEELDRTGSACRLSATGTLKYEDVFPNKGIKVANEGITIGLDSKFILWIEGLEQKIKELEEKIEKIERKKPPLGDGVTFLDGKFILLENQIHILFNHLSDHDVKINDLIALK